MKLWKPSKQKQLASPSWHHLQRPVLDFRLSPSPLLTLFSLSVPLCSSNTSSGPDNYLETEICDSVLEKKVEGRWGIFGNCLCATE